MLLKWILHLFIFIGNNTPKSKDIRGVLAYLASAA